MKYRTYVLNFAIKYRQVSPFPCTHRYVTRNAFGREVIHMSVEDCKNFITIELEKMGETDNRFLRQLCTIIKCYINGRRGH